MKSDFVSTVSHELRTPLTSIYGFAETLLRQDVAFGEEERAMFLGYIASESERLTRDRRRAAQRRAARHGRPPGRPRADRRRLGRQRRGRRPRRRRPTNGHRFVVDLPEEPLARAGRSARSCARCSTTWSRTRSSTRRAAARSRVAARRRHGRASRSRVADEGIGIPQARARADLPQVLPRRRRPAAAAARASGCSSPRGSSRRWAGGSGSTREKGQGSSFTLRAARCARRGGARRAEVDGRSAARTMRDDGCW